MTAEFLTSENTPSTIVVKELLEKYKIDLKHMGRLDFINFMKTIPDTPVKKAILQEYNDLHPQNETNVAIIAEEVKCETNCSVFLNQAKASPPGQLIMGTAGLLGDTTANVSNAIGSLISWPSSQNNKGGRRRRRSQRHRQRRTGRTRRHKKR